MRRRDFLRAIAALPLVPAAVRGWAEERAEALEPEPAAQLNDRLLAFAAGDPSVTVVVPPGRTLSIGGTALVTGIDGRAAELRIYEDGKSIAAEAWTGAAQCAMHVNTIRRPPPGTHTYRLGVAGVMDMGRLYPPSLWVERVE